MRAFWQSIKNILPTILILVGVGSAFAAWVTDRNSIKSDAKLGVAAHKRVVLLDRKVSVIEDRTHHLDRDFVYVRDRLDQFAGYFGLPEIPKERNDETNNVPHP